MPAAWEAAARRGWSPDEFAAALAHDLSPAAGPGSVVNAARALAAKPPPCATSRAAAEREAARRAAPDCEHGTPHGTYRRTDGTPACPVCRSETRAAS